VGDIGREVREVEILPRRREKTPPSGPQKQPRREREDTPPARPRRKEKQPA
jgi:hypothetical protein